jgi:oxygen-independent coproporphyrinogen-3 oxidase
MNPFGIYLHWPFCAAKCPYCDFNSHVRPRVDEGQWARLVQRELARVASLQHVRPPVQSIFFGGGTPSLMTGVAVAAVLEAISRLWSVAPDIEVTLEANPNSVEQQRFRDYRAAGVNRVSIGVQSFDAESLKQLGRLHDAAEAKQAIALAIEVFPRVNFDLIYARPGQTIRAWEDELQSALAFGTEHLSLYQLTIEQGTAFATLHRSGKLVLPEDDIAAEFYTATQEVCDAAGLPAYEVSNHARTGGESRHNLLYWRYGDYAGIGPGAHGRLTLDERRIATESERLPERWAVKIETAGQGFSTNEISQHDAAREHLLMNLRLREGVDIAALAARWGLVPGADAVSRLQRLGLLRNDPGRLAATSAGGLVLNRLVQELTDSLGDPL